MTSSHGWLRLAAAALLGVAFGGAARAAEIRWIYPPPNSLITASPLSVVGYVAGPPRASLEARVVGADGGAAPVTEPLYLFKGRVFSGSISLSPGRNNVAVGDSVLPLLYKPGFDGDRDGEFRRPRAHGGKIDSCNPCHGFLRGDLVPKAPVPELCLGCHKVGTESLRAVTKQNEHTRTITPQCLRCHEPHGSFEPRLLRSAGSPCAPCHAAQSGASLHSGVGSGCGACHDAHSSAYPKLLKGEPLGLCRTCHAPVAAPERYPRSFHRPVEDGKCFGCHQPHAGPARSLLAKPTPALCRDCHPAGEEGAHRGRLETCGTCHEAHQSTDRKLLKKTVSGSCAECHPPFPEAASRHPALKDGCVSCHNPHRPQGLVDSGQVCGRCHNLGEERFKWTHGRLPMGDVRQCSLCHEPHTSKFARLLRGKIHYPLGNGGCSTCHLVQDGVVTLKYEGSKNCLRCHGQVTGTSQIVDAEKAHRPVYQQDCVACHNPHLAARPKLLLEDPQVLCGWCHGLLLRGVDNVHGVFKQAGGDCYTCHLPHISDFKPLLKRPELELCGKCHQGVRAEDGAAARLVHGVVAQGRCSGCHNPHGTNTPSLLKGSPDALCRDCHGAVTRTPGGAPWRYLHGPVGSGTCTACHALAHRHRQGGDRFLLGKGSEVCARCHDTPLEHVPANYRAKAREVRNDCLVCHAPHGAGNPALLR